MDIFLNFTECYCFVFINTICIEGETLMNEDTRNKVNQKASNIYHS